MSFQFLTPPKVGGRGAAGPRGRTGFVLGPILERSVRRSILISGRSLDIFVTDLAVLPAASSVPVEGAPAARHTDKQHSPTAR